MLLLHTPDAQSTTRQISTTTASLKAQLGDIRKDVVYLSKKIGAVGNLTNLDLNQIYLIASCLAKLKRVTLQMIDIETGLWIAQGDESRLPKDEDIEAMFKKVPS